MQNELDRIQAKISTMIAFNQIPLPVTNDKGDPWVVVALPSEPLTALIQRVGWARGCANVFVPMDDGVIQFDVVDQHGAVDADPQPVEIYDDNTSTVGLFVEMLRNTAGPVGLKVHDQDSPFTALQASEARIADPAVEMSASAAAPAAAASV